MRMSDLRLPANRRLEGEAIFFRNTAGNVGSFRYTISFQTDGSGNMINCIAGIDLPAKHVPHTGYPIWLKDTDSGERLVLTDCVADGSHSDGPDVMHSAAQLDNPDLITDLVDGGHDPSVAIRGQGATPLHVAAGRGCLNAARVLVERGGNSNAPDNNGLTPLHVAVLEEQSEIVELLILHRADPELTAGDGNNAHDIAQKYGLASIARLLHRKKSSQQVLLDDASHKAAASQDAGHEAAAKKWWQFWK